MFLNRFFGILQWFTGTPLHIRRRTLTEVWIGSFVVHLRVLWNEASQRAPTYTGRCNPDVCAYTCGIVAYFRVQNGQDGSKLGAALLSVWISPSRNAHICAQRWGTAVYFQRKCCALDRFSLTPRPSRCQIPPNPGAGAPAATQQSSIDRST